MNANEEKLLKAVTKEWVSGEKAAESSGLQYSTVMSVLSTLEEEGLVEVRREEKEVLQLTEEGKRYAEKGLPEKRLADAVEKKEMPLDEALKKAGLADEEKGIALQWAKRKGFIALDKGLVRACKAGKDAAEKALKEIAQGKPATSQELVERRLVAIKKEKKVFVRLTGKKGGGEEITQLTPELLKSGGWKGKKFAEYDLGTVIAPLSIGRKHPYNDFLNRIKEKLVAMGFQEVHGPLVELEFWNMDALFMAQDHPAREIHDVFQVDDPARGEILDGALLEQVRTSHEDGLAGSKGWRYKWDPEVAMRLVMRSQTTAVSARNLARGVKPPVKLFCVGRVFRPDEIDWKHFIEFNQCEGIVVDESMSFRELLGYLKEFAVEVFGAKDVKFVPSYFPFTEPSVELFAEIPGKGWAEVGGAGMFRPEMLSALGVDVPVLAWGLGVDRLAMLSLGVTDLRELFSHKLEFLRK